MFQNRTATLLHVSADDAGRYALGQVLREQRFAVREAADGAETVRPAADLPDRILRDFALPEMSGSELSGRLKAHAATALMPFL
jgi:CheY-like chemotaxis protein